MPQNCRATKNTVRASRMPDRLFKYSISTVNYQFTIHRKLINHKNILGDARKIPLYLEENLFSSKYNKIQSGNKNAQRNITVFLHNMIVTKQ